MDFWQANFVLYIYYIFQINNSQSHVCKWSLVLTFSSLFCYLMKQVVRDDSSEMDAHNDHVLHFVEVQRLQLSS